MADSMKQFGKSYRKQTRDSEYNTRRFAENFPNLERKVDVIDYEYPFDMEFYLSDHPHTVSLNLQFKPPEMFRCSQAIPPTSSSQASCEATGYTYDYEATTFSYTYTGGVITQTYVDTGDATPVIYTEFISNIGGFEFNPYGGIIVPQTGYYNVNFKTGSAFLTTDRLSTFAASVRRNGIIVNQVIWRVGNTNPQFSLPPPITYHVLDVDIWGLCIEANAGDVLGGFVTSVALYGANWEEGTTKIALIGTG